MPGSRSGLTGWSVPWSRGRAIRKAWDSSIGNGTRAGQGVVGKGRGCPQPVLSRKGHRDSCTSGMFMPRLPGCSRDGNRSGGGGTGCHSLSLPWLSLMSRNSWPCQQHRVPGPAVLGVPARSHPALAQRESQGNTVFPRQQRGQGFWACELCQSSERTSPGSCFLSCQMGAISHWAICLAKACISPVQACADRGWPGPWDPGYCGHTAPRGQAPEHQPLLFLPDPVCWSQGPTAAPGHGQMVPGGERVTL